MPSLAQTIEDLVAANRILENEGVFDAYGHCSARHPDRPDRFLLSRARTPRRVTAEDIMEFTMDGEPVDPRGRQCYIERYIHAGMYQKRQDTLAIIHSHSLITIPFGCAGFKLRPMLHNTSVIGKEVPIWDPDKKFGDTDLMVTNLAMGLDLGEAVADHPAVLMRGHGAVTASKTVRRAAYIAIKLQEAALLQRDAEASGLKNIKYLTPGEIKVHTDVIDKITNKPLQGVDRYWEYLCDRADVPFKEGSSN